MTPDDLLADLGNGSKDRAMRSHPESSVTLTNLF